VDTPLWVTVLVAVLAAAAGYLGNDVTSRRDRAQAREQSDRDWLEKAATLCRSADAKEREHGLGFLRALIKLPEIDPRVQDLLDEMTQQELGQTLVAAREALAETGELPDIVEVPQPGVGTQTGDQPEEVAARDQEGHRGNA
jgi:GrpB-like predicted nucleotidyltransferase (UPF0157 family)